MKRENYIGDRFSTPKNGKGRKKEGEKLLSSNGLRWEGRDKEEEVQRGVKERVSQTGARGKKGATLKLY